MDTVIRRTICIHNNAVDIYQPLEFLAYLKSPTISAQIQIPVGRLNHIYNVETVRIDENCPTGVVYDLLFLEDALHVLPVSAKNLEIILDTWKYKVNERDVLTAWAKPKYLKIGHDKWEELIGKKKSTFESFTLPQINLSLLFVRLYKC